MKSISFMLILKNNCFKIKVLREFNSAHKKCENIFFVLKTQSRASTRNSRAGLSSFIRLKCSR